MRKLIIQNIGPITKPTTINLKRFNFFIGPQSSGKSTIAKILSTILWIEKEACTTLSEDVLPEGVSFKDFVENFHRMHKYINETTSIVKYESDYISCSYEQGNFILHLKPDNNYKRIKVSYMPSDRNVVTMKDLEKRNLEPTNFRSFLFDWLDCNKHYDSKHKADILDLNVKYYYDAKQNEKQDKIVHQNGATYDLSLYDASSGLQSVVPMIVLIDYLTSQYFETYAKETSFERENQSRNRLQKLIELYLDANPEESVSDTYKRYRSLAQDGDENALQKVTRMFNHFQRLTNPDSIFFILEEPEQNLFTRTQVDVLYQILSSCNREHKSSATVTTHSPYILSAVNISLLAGKLRSMGVPDKELEKIIPIDSVISDGDAGVFAVGNGTCKSIVDRETGLINQNELDIASEYNAAVFDKLYKLFIQQLRNR